MFRKKKPVARGRRVLGGLAVRVTYNLVENRPLFLGPVENVTNPEQIRCAFHPPDIKTDLYIFIKPLKPNVNKKLALFPVADVIISDIFRNSFILDSFVGCFCFCVCLSYGNI
jgi:hypothetical protein